MFPGLPLGGDIRFATTDAVVHLDLKLTGPRDNPDEIVASPHQISGDSAGWEGEGFRNSLVMVTGPRRRMPFQPTLPPFYVLNRRTLICLTYFLKAIYTVEGSGHQPLALLELACVPNGLLAFDGPRYGETPGLFIPGKDTQDTPDGKRRTRIRLQPLAELAPWRCAKLRIEEDEVIVSERAATRRLFAP